MEFYFAKVLARDPNHFFNIPINMYIIELQGGPTYVYSRVP